MVFAGGFVGMSFGLREKRKNRLGAAAMEFGLIAPVLMVVAGGLGEYGWYFHREAMVTNVLESAVRAGSNQKQISGEAAGVCSQCVSVANSAATAGLAAIGITLSNPGATMQAVTAGGTTTYAVQLNPSIPHTRIFSIAPGPSSIDVTVVALAQNL
jgi:Flp pilus assembly protein TadG